MKSHDHDWAPSFEQSTRLVQRYRCKICGAWGQRDFAKPAAGVELCTRVPKAIDFTQPPRDEPALGEAELREPSFSVFAYDLEQEVDL